ncbi:response regulator [Flavobacterium algicola]|uniref:response regulator n=1 Tax=Flavobacterium algicola TaxID=556529 RepID=UPI001EFE541E|nr:response regulator [Flavobacterium algicola]MCG9791049.1 response regulator [Flavobacterium algicola]
MAQNIFFDGLVFGLLIKFSLFMLFLYFAMRSIKILVLSFFILFSGFIPFMLDGYFINYFNAISSTQINNLFLLILIITGLLLAKFGKLSLKVKKNNQPLYLFFQIFYILNIILFPISCLFPYDANVFLMIATTFGFVIFILIAIGIIMNKKEGRSLELFFVFGLATLITGYITYSLKVYSILPATDLVKESTEISISLTIILFTIKEVLILFKLRQAKDKLRKMALIKAQEMKDLKCYLFCNISHELRTPLNVITNFSKYISEKTTDKDIIDKCENIQNYSGILLNSIDDILDFTKLEKNELKIENVIFNPLKTLMVIKEGAQSRTEEKGLQFNFVASNDFPKFISGDEKKFVQIINHVISNAIKFTAEGVITFDISSHLMKDGRAQISILIIDTGVGIESDKMDSIFDSFSQYKIDNKRKFGGLGLFLVRELVTMLDGKFSVQSEIGRGTSCKIILDFDIVEVDEQVVEKNKVMEYDLGGKTILVVEDNKMNQMIIKMITKSWENTNVLFADNGEEGVKAVKNNKIDLILMDLQMPVMDGYEATIAIRSGEAGAENNDIPIIAVTADVMEVTKLRVIEVGMNDYLSKPIDKLLLYKTVSKCLNIQGLINEVLK